MRFWTSVFCILVASTPVLAQDFTAIDKLEGWWAYQDGWVTPEQGCRDTDGKERVAIGRYKYDDQVGSVVFGVGEQRAIGFYDSSCTLATPMSVGDQVAAAGECQVEGEESQGIVSFETIDPHTIRVTVPDMKPGLVLTRCRVDYSSITWPMPPREIHYGSRAGMTMTVLEASALDTEAAMLYVEHTEKDAMSVCVQYAQSTDPDCIERALSENKNLETKLTANCELGTFNTPYGGHYRFQSKNTSSAKTELEYIILDVDNGNQALDGSSASGYGVALGIFTALCPSRV